MTNTDLKTLTMMNGHEERGIVMSKICGECQYHRPPEIPGQDGWWCNNGQSENYAMETDYEDTCDEWEERLPWKHS